MQTLYSLGVIDFEAKPGEAIVNLKNNFEQTRHLFTYLVHFITEVARYAEVEAAQKAHKHLPNEGDLNINTKISGNELVWAILENRSLQKAFSDFAIVGIPDKDLVRKIYMKLKQTEEYKFYITGPARDKKSEKKIIEFILEAMLLPNEDFITHIEEHFIHWDDDADMMIVLLNNFFQKPSSFNFNELLDKERWQFAKELLECVIDKQEQTLEIIKPKLKNWDVERIAALDMILMQMGVCELLYFETIPPRVTINEYIDLAKEYSTEQSGHFVNGILDNIHKELLYQNKIHKKKFKNSTL